MKRLFLTLSLLFFAFQLSFSQSVAINNDGSPADPSAILDVKSINKGLLLPRLSSVQRHAITHPATGLMVFDTDTKSVWLNNGTTWVNANAASSANFWTESNGNIYNNNTGNVGIKIDNPKFPLSFERSYGEKVSFWDDASTAGSYGIGVQFRLLQIHSNDSNDDIAFGYGSTASKNFTERMRIKGNGNIGIGTTTPQSKLHFIGDLTTDWGTTFYHYQPSFDGDNQKRPWLRRDWNGATVGDYLMLSSTGNRSNKDESAIVLAQNGIFLGRGMDDGSGLSQQWMQIDPNGNISIGTQKSPGKLNVGGTIFSTEVQVNLENQWPDYVFNESYDLRPLSEVEKFIKANNHLPGISSAKEIQKNGLALGEMQTKMMQKIEELTLYLIEANKQIEQLKEEVRKLQEK